MTEEEATKKVCPQSVVPVVTPANGVSFEPLCCLGSACMAWRWNRNEFGHGDGGGYCGLVGKPT